MRRDERAVLAATERLSSDAFLLHFRSEELYRSFVPGQFTMLRIPERIDLLLRRPYSFCDRDLAERTFSLLVKEAGEGTKALARLPVGSAVSCLGPLGSAFRFPEPSRRAVVIAGGVGIAPFVGFCRSLREAGRTATVLLGGRSAQDLYLRSEFEAFGMDVRCSTEDGSFGHRGLVTEILAPILGSPDPVELFSCGPTPMLVKVAAMARERNLPHQVSLERRMGCGMGCCLGCVVYAESSGNGGGGEYVRCCTEGPVFEAATVRWEKDPYPL